MQGGEAPAFPRYQCERVPPSYRITLMRVRHEAGELRSEEDLVSELWQGVLWGALLSIPIGIIVNVASPTISRSLDSRNSRAAAKRSAEDQEFRAAAALLAKDRSALYTLLLESLLRIAFVSAIFGALAGVLALVGQLLPSFLAITYLGGFGWEIEVIPSLVYAASQLAALIGTILVLNIARQAVTLIREVRKPRDGA
jgi:hypothetical protein